MTFRSTWRGCAAALLIAMLGTGSAAAQSDDGGGGGGAGVEIRTVSTIAPLRTDNGERARAVYRALIPDGLELPAEPAVSVWLAEAAFVAGRGRPADDASHWLEGAVQIRVLRRGPDGKEIEGWYPIHYPVTGEFWFQLGRYVGLPKRHATASFTAAGPGWIGQATPRDTTGGPSFEMDWQPSGGADQAAVARAFAVSTDPLLVLNKPLEGPDLMRVQYTVGSPGFVVPGGPPAYDPKTSKPDPGTVRLRVREDLDALQEADLRKLFPPGTTLADLIVTDQTLPGAHAFYTVALGSESEKIGEGGYGSPRDVPPGDGGAGGDGGATRPGQTPPSSTPPRRRCTRRRAITMRVRAFRGAKVRSVRVYVDGRRVRARVLSRRRVRVSLRRARAGRHRITVVVRQARGVRMTTRRVVVVCPRKKR